MSYTAVLDTDNVTATRINTLAGEIDGNIDNIIDGTTAIVPQIADFTSAQHDHSDADDGGKIAESAVSVAGGSAGQVLTVNPGGTASEWADTPTTALTTKGDLLTKNNLLALTRVPVGSNEQVLVADSAQSTGMKWANRTRMATGTYTGNGAATQAITGLGFQPKVVEIWWQTASSPNWGKKTDQDGLNAILNTSGVNLYNTDHIISLDSDGFTVGDGSSGSNSLNINLKVYTWIAYI